MGTSLKITPILIIVLAVLARLFPHPPNFAPITAIALFGGVYLPKKYAFILPIAAMLISDFFIGFDLGSLGSVYASFIISGLIGLWVRNRKRVSTVFVGALLSSVLFYLITNFEVWVNPHSWYSKDLLGLISSYIAGVPFFRNTLLGDLFYTGAIFTIYELSHSLALRIVPKKFLNIIF